MLLVAEHHETREKLVVYRSIGPDHIGSVSVRELNDELVDSWNDLVGGIDSYRFTQLDDGFEAQEALQALLTTALQVTDDEECLKHAQRLAESVFRARRNMITLFGGMP